MAISVFFESSGLIGQTEWSLTDNTAFPSYVTQSGIYQAFINTSGMVAGDEYTLKLYEQATNVAGDLSFPTYTSTLYGIQGQPIFATPALVLGNMWDMTLNGSGVAGRNFFWSIRRIA